MILIVIPTIPGREESLARTLGSYLASPCDVRIRIYPDSPSSGAGWLNGVALDQKLHDPPDYVHLTNDDCKAVSPDWWEPCIEACDKGMLPAPIVYNSDGSLQSAGGMIGAPDNLMRPVGEDWSSVGFTTIPFMSWEQWRRIGMISVHYASDVWVSERGRQLGIESVLRHGYEITHWNHTVGRGAGMSQQARDVQDRGIVERHLAGAG